MESAGNASAVRVFAMSRDDLRDLQERIVLLETNLPDYWLLGQAGDLNALTQARTVFALGVRAAGVAQLLGLGY